MLAQRVITAVVMLAVLLGALLAPSPWILVALLTAAAASALWEWLRLTWPRRPSGAPLACAVAVAVLLCAVALQWLGQAPAAWSLRAADLASRWLFPAVGAIWIFCGLGMVIQGRSGARTGMVCLSVFGIFAILAAWMALVRFFLIYGPWRSEEHTSELQSLMR